MTSSLTFYATPSTDENELPLGVAAFNAVKDAGGDCDLQVNGAPIHMVPSENGWIPEAPPVTDPAPAATPDTPDTPDTPGPEAPPVTDPAPAVAGCGVDNCHINGRHMHPKV